MITFFWSFLRFWTLLRKQPHCRHMHIPRTLSANLGCVCYLCQALRRVLLFCLHSPSQPYSWRYNIIRPYISFCLPPSEANRCRVVPFSSEPLGSSCDLLKTWISPLGMCISSEEPVQAPVCRFSRTRHCTHLDTNTFVIGSEEMLTGMGPMQLTSVALDM